MSAKKNRKVINEEIVNEEIVVENEENTVDVSTMSLEGVLKLYGTKSNAIRNLYSNSFTKSEIAKILRIRYQHVRNVLNQPLKKKN